MKNNSDFANKFVRRLLSCSSLFVFSDGVDYFDSARRIDKFHLVSLTGFFNDSVLYAAKNPFIVTG